MPGFVGDDTCLQTATDEREVADDVEQFVSCRFVVEVDGREVAELGGIQTGLTEFVGEVVQSLLRHGRLVDDESVLEVTALDESEAKQGLNLADKTERACGGNLAGVLLQITQLGTLALEDLRRVAHLHLDLIRVGGEEHEAVAVLGDIFDRFAHDVDLGMRTSFLLRTCSTYLHGSYMNYLGLMAYQSSDL